MFSLPMRALPPTASTWGCLQPETSKPWNPSPLLSSDCLGQPGRARLQRMEWMWHGKVPMQCAVLQNSRKYAVIKRPQQQKGSMYARYLPNVGLHTYAVRSTISVVIVLLAVLVFRQRRRERLGLGFPFPQTRGWVRGPEHQGSDLRSRRTESAPPSLHHATSLSTEL